MGSEKYAQATEEIDDPTKACFFCKKVPLTRYGIYHENCLQVFCKPCLKVNKISKCPFKECEHDETPFGKPFEDLEENIYEEYFFSCAACSEILDYNHLNSHLQYFKLGAFECVAGCKNGQTYHSTEQYKDHLKNDCAESTVICDLCLQSLSANQAEQQDHARNYCPHRDISTNSAKEPASNDANEEMKAEVYE